MEKRLSDSAYELRYIERYSGYIEIYNGIARFPCDSTAFDLVLSVTIQYMRVTDGRTNRQTTLPLARVRVEMRHAEKKPENETRKLDTRRGSK